METQFHLLKRILVQQKLKKFRKTTKFIEN